MIHDLCYITPGVTKTVCDRVMEDNINTIYCNNVNRLDIISKYNYIEGWEMWGSLSNDLGRSRVG